MIEAERLAKSYGNKTALANVSFKTKENGVTGFLGPNGAGKSTVMNILTGCITPDEGSVLINGSDIREKPIQAKKNIGYLPEIPPLYGEMTVEEYLAFVYSVKRVKQKHLTKSAHLNELAGLTGIKDVMKRVIGNLSKGYKQRVGLAGALVGNPQVIILDEPTAGLDPVQIIETRELIRELGTDHDVVLSSHILPEISAVCGKILIINKGRIVLDTNVENLIADENKIQLQIEGRQDKITALLKKFGGVNAIKPEYYEIETKSDIRKEVWQVLSENKLPVLMMKREEVTLEEIYSKIVSAQTEGDK
jgi:ABC-2 type transport system ATP-binding protein